MVDQQSAQLREAQRLWSNGKPEQAAAACQELLEQQPDCHEAMLLLAGILLQAGSSDGAVPWLERACELAADFPGAHAGLGQALELAGRYEDAVLAYRRALELAPAWSEIADRLAGALAAVGRLDEAIAAARRVVELVPQRAEAHQRLGALLAVAARGTWPIPADRIAEARQCFELAAELRADWSAPWRDLGRLENEAGCGAAAIKAYRRAIQVQPDDWEAHAELGTVLLSQSAFAEGWQELEWRFHNGGRPAAHPSCSAPVWDGEPLAGRSIAVFIEQGLGDHLQMLRFVPELARRGARVWLQAPGPLRRLDELSREMLAVDRIIGQELPAEPPDLQIPLMSLPHLLGSDVRPNQVAFPYLRTSEAELQQARAVVADASGLRVGIVWAGKPGNAWVERRDCDLRLLTRLARLAGVSVFSLQHGARARDLDSYPGCGIINLEDRLGDLATTAALIQVMDLVITVDTVTAHLAGALARPVWTLLAEPADWRWMHGRSDIPWYPTMRLYRQDQHRQNHSNPWSAVIDEVEHDLIELTPTVKPSRPLVAVAG